MTPADRPSKTAADEAAIAAGREKHEAVVEVTPVVIEKVAAVVQNATDAAATLVTTGLKEAAVEVAGPVATVAQDLKAADAEKARLLAIDNSRKFVLAVILGLAAIVVPGVPAIIAAFYGRDNAVQIEKVHKLVNSNYGTQLKLVVNSARIAAESRGLPADIEAYEAAKAALDEHNRQQALIDAKE